MGLNLLLVATTISTSAGSDTRDVRADPNDSLGTVQGDAANGAIVTQAILWFRRVVAREKYRQIVGAIGDGAGSIDAPGIESIGAAAYGRGLGEP